MSAQGAPDTEALLSLLGMAQQEISAALVEFAPPQAEQLRQLCSGHLENIVFASGQAGFDDLYLVAEAVLTRFDDQAQPFDAESGSAFLNWISDARLYLESPQEAGSILLLLSPLPEETQQALGAILGEGAGDEPVASAADAAAPPAETMPPAATDTALDDIEIDTDNVLGMLAYELREVSPELAALAQSLVGAAGADELAGAVEAYREIVQRIATVARDLELQGLTLICEFVERNLNLLGGIDAALRAPSLEVLQHWPRTLIEHLLHPADDARCIAVVDYLERDAWPQPLPYREMRELIEGLTRALENSDGYVAELREIEATPDAVELTLSADASPELIDAFFAESPAHAEMLSSLMQAIGRAENVQQNVEAAQRIAHTLKGSGNLVGVSGIANLAHHIEDIFDYIARNRIAPPTALANTMQEAADTIEGMIEALQNLGPAPADALRVLQDVLDWANRIDSGKMRREDYAADAEDGAAETEAPAAPEIAEQHERRRASDREDAAPASAAESVRVPLKLLDNIFRIVSETAITAGQIQERLNRLDDSEKMIRSNDGALQQQRYELENLVNVRAMATRHRGAMAQGSAEFDPLELDEYDEFYGATHAYIETVTDSREILRGFSGEVQELSALFNEQQRLNKELQQIVMMTRLVPVGNIASRLQRTLRQVCRATGKQAELSILGQDLLLDGDVLNRLADPLMHMLRNAVDHGIEDETARAAAGKPPLGRIELQFRQEGNNVVIRCSDDGAGLDYERIRKVAVERGLLGEGEAADQQALAGLILQSGFSTSTEVTHVSGRGVGMDVVHNTIQALNGAMDIGEAAGGGTLVTMRMPITLLTSHCLLVAVKDNLYAIPTLALTQILSPGTGSIGRVNDKMTFELEQDVYPAYTLNSLIGAAEAGDEAVANSSVLLVQTPDGVSAVSVERVVTSYDLVVKNMGAYIKSVSGIAGVSMLGNGEVVPVLDLAAMLRAQANRGTLTTVRTAAAPADEVQLPRVLIVDDSLSVRNSLAQLMQDSGYQAVLARDGREAVNLLEAEQPDVVLTDLEMPRMNGLELVAYMRNSDRWRDLPAVMITSRNMSKHRQEAERVGVNRFIPKPFSDDDVLDAIDEQLATLA